MTAQPSPGLSSPGEIVRARDPDRFLTTLFAPAARREALWTLYAFNHELARAREATREPMMALLRLQWWREVIEGARRRHEVAGPLGEAIDSGLLDPAFLEPMVAGREMEAAPIETEADWREYLLAAHGGVGAAAAAALGADRPGQDAARRWTAIYGGAGVLRSALPDAQAGRCRLPEDVLARHGATPDRPTAEVLDELATTVAALDAPGSLPRAAVAAALPAVLGRRDLRAPGAPRRPRGLGDRLAVAVAALRGHV